MDQAWFEMADIRRRTFAAAVWIPLRAADASERQRSYGEVGYREVFFGVGSAAFTVEQRTAVEKLEWSDIGIGRSHSPWIRNGEYLPSDRFDGGYKHGPIGLNLVLEQSGSGSALTEWHLHQDLVLALGLFREGDKWVRPHEGYVEVARLKRRDNGRPTLLEIRSEHLRDYLAARGMGIYITSFHSRDEIIEDASHISWPDKKHRVDAAGVCWEGRVMPIHEGEGSPFGSSTAVFHVSNDSVDHAADVPAFTLPAGSGTSSRQWTVSHDGREVYRVLGETWKNEWIAPLDSSPRVRGDEVPPTVSFVTDAGGKRETKATLHREGHWLWFRPDLVSALLSYRDSHLEWYTRETGGLGINSDSTLHFGINSIGLVNIYAKDIGQLDDWQQQVWAGYNVAPDGGVSAELLAAQVKAVPSDTQAPEAFLQRALARLDEAAQVFTGQPVLRPHDDTGAILKRCHRFRAMDEASLLSLAKDLTRLTADSIDTTTVQKALPPSKDKIASLKALEKLLALRCDDATAREAMTPLFGLYDLRLADAHLASKDLAAAYERAGIDITLKPIFQGQQMLHTLVDRLFSIAHMLDGAGHPL